MNDAPCSWRVSTYRIEEREMASTKWMFSSPGIPNTWVTPALSRHSTIRSAVLGEGSAMTARLGACRPSARHRPGVAITPFRRSADVGCWQALTPDELLGRTNATRRSANRTMAALGALIASTIAAARSTQPRKAFAAVGGGKYAIT